jgi:hypothetical protein
MEFDYDISRMVICETPREVVNVIRWGFQYAYRDRTFTDTYLGPLHKLSEAQIKHIGSTYSQWQREAFGQQIPNLVLDVPKTWRRRTQRYRRKLDLLLSQSDFRAARLFFMVPTSKPRRMSWPWRILALNGTVIFQSKDMSKHTADRMRRLHALCRRSYILRYMVAVEQELGFDGHLSRVELSESSGIMTGDQR